jgi:hypothetical protein
VPGTSDDPNRLLKTYRQSNDPAANRFLITNPDDAYRTYRGIEVTANRRWDDRWLMQASWVYSKTTSNLDNTSSQGNTADYDDPNIDPRFQPLRDGRPSLDNTQIGKLLGAYHARWGIIASAAYFYASGDTFNRSVRFRLPQGNRTLFAESRGFQRYEAQQRLDIKVEKQFGLGTNGRLGLTVEGFNIFNDSTVTERQTRSGSTYLVPLEIVQARRWRIGGVYRF